jgi:serine/threonine protein kinase
LALELAKGGELFDYISQTGEFSEDVARYFFHQLIDALDYMNKKGISHRDLKPENILMSEVFDLKLADFGFGSNTETNMS